jgi:hypothetical protein
MYVQRAKVGCIGTFLNSVSSIYMPAFMTVFSLAPDDGQIIFRQVSLP